jgi:hypothetical protein
MNRDVTGVLAFPEGFPKSLRRWREDHEVPDARHLRNCVGVGAQHKNRDARCAMQRNSGFDIGSK